MLCSEGLGGWSAGFNPCRGCQIEGLCLESVPRDLEIGAVDGLWSGSGEPEDKDLDSPDSNPSVWPGRGAH